MERIETDKVLHETFLLEEFLGEGASGQVYKAKLIRDWNNLKSGSSVALKFYKKEIFNREDKENVIKRRVREATSQSLFNHPNIVKTFDTQEFWNPDKNYYFLAMEYLLGFSLQQVTKDHIPLNEEEIFRIVNDLVSGLNEMHKAKVLHRDLKPANIQLCTDWRTVILDLGVIRPLSDETITSSQQFLGTLRFAAPEWLFAEESSEKSDIYSLGAVIYSMFHGYDVFADIDLFSRLVVAVREKEIEIVQERESLQGALLIDLVVKMLNKDPKKRPSLTVILDFLVNLDQSEIWKELKGKRAKSMFGFNSDNIEKWCNLTKIISAEDIDSALALNDPRVFRDPKVVVLLAPYLNELTGKGYSTLDPEERVRWVTAVFDPEQEENWNLLQFRDTISMDISEVEKDEEVLEQIKPILEAAQGDWILAQILEMWV